MGYENIKAELCEGGVGLITLSRPQVLNALSIGLARELAQALDVFDKDKSVGVVVVTGSEKAFAAGVDIKEMKDKDYIDMFLGNFPTPPGSGWERLETFRKPVIAAVAGYALGGGCELAMACDFILAAENAKFGQPEIKLGTLPGAGGTQRLTRLVGKAKAMEMCLTGRMMDAVEAERMGLVSRVVPTAQLLEEALKTAASIAAMSRPVAMMIKEAVNTAYETALHEGLLYERRLFQASFATEDRLEGMTAFIDKRVPVFKHR